jgi:hypothetical protein
MNQSISKHLFCEVCEQGTHCLIKLFDETEQIDLSSQPLVDTGSLCAANYSPTSNYRYTLKLSSFP